MEYPTVLYRFLPIILEILRRDIVQYKCSAVFSPATLSLLVCHDDGKENFGSLKWRKIIVQYLI